MISLVVEALKVACVLFESLLDDVTHTVQIWEEVVRGSAARPFSEQARPGQLEKGSSSESRSLSPAKLVRNSTDKPLCIVHRKSQRGMTSATIVHVDDNLKSRKSRAARDRR